jgi:arylsulfatase
MFYDKWMIDRAFLLVPAQAIVGEFLETFAEFPPRQTPASFSIDQALEKAREKQRALAPAPHEERAPAAEEQPAVH